MRLKLLIGGVLLVLGLGAAALKFNQPKLAEAGFARAVPKQMSQNVMTNLDEGLHVILCGTGSPMPDSARKGPCTAVIAGGRLFVVDVGGGAGRNFSPMGLPLARTEAVLLTHYHSDHFGGLGEFLISRWLGTGAKAPLPVYGPEGIDILIGDLNNVYSFDQAYRIHDHGELMPASGFGGEARSFELGADDSAIVLDDKGLKITAFKVDHGGIPAAVGYRFDYKGRSVVISGDTSRSSNLERYAKDADILIHEALNEEMVDVMRESFSANGRPRMAQIFQDIKSIHTTPVEAARSAKIAGVDMLVLSHIIPAAPSAKLDGYFMKGAAAEYDGPIIMGHDGMMFSLPAGSHAIDRADLL